MYLYAIDKQIHTEIMIRLRAGFSPLYAVYIHVDIASTKTNFIHYFFHHVMKKTKMRSTFCLDLRKKFNSISFKPTARIEISYSFASDNIKLMMSSTYVLFYTMKQRQNAWKITDFWFIGKVVTGQ